MNDEASLGTSTLLNKTGVNNLAYNPYAGLDRDASERFTSRATTAAAGLAYRF